MKTPDEIKKGLECCQNFQSCTEFGEPKCPYNDIKECVDILLADALAYIQQLESQNAELLTKVEQLEAKCHQLERERDAAVNELIGTCQVCRWEETVKCSSCHFNSDAWNVCESNWEWCGVKEE